MPEPQTRSEPSNKIVLESILKTHKEKPERFITFLDLEEKERKFADKVAGYRRGARFLSEEKCSKGHEGITLRVDGTLYCGQCDRVYGHRG